MQEDIAALKKGQTPVGFQIEKQSVKESSPIQQSAMPTPIFKQSPSPHVELGRLEKSRPMEGTRFSVPSSLKIPGISPTSPSVPEPSTNSLGGGGGIKLPSLGSMSSRKLLWGGASILIVIVGVLVFFVMREPSPPEVTFSLTPISTSTPTPSKPYIEGVFSLFSKVSISVDTDVFQTLVSATNVEVLNGGASALYKLNDPQNTLDYTFSSFMSSALITVPEEVKTFINENDFYLSLKQKAPGKYSGGIIVKLSSDVGLSQAMSRWETNIPSSFAALLGLNTAEAASIEFLDNTYQGLSIRYKNFPDPLKTIDYAIVSGVHGDKYLVIADSREHIYSIIDTIR